MTSCTGNSTQCGGSPRYGIVYHCPTCSSGSGSGSSTVVVYTTTDSKGSTYVTSTTSTLPSTSVVVYSTTDSHGSTYVTSTTSTIPATSASTSVVVYTTTDSKGSSYVTSTTSTTPPKSYPTGPSVIVVTSSQTIITTDSHGSTVTSISTTVASSTTTYSGSSPGTTSSVPSLPSGVCRGNGGPGIYKDASGQLYEVYCGTDIPGKDLTTPHVSTFSDCLLACDNYVPDKSRANGAACIAASFGYGNVGGNCYLKYEITTFNTGDGGFDCARMIGYNPPSPTTTSLGLPGTSVKASSNGNQQGQSTPAGGNTTPGPVDPGTQTSSAPNYGPTSSVNPSTAPFPCPAYDQIGYVDTNGETYHIECGASYPGKDLTTPHKDTFQDCILACDSYVPSPSVAGGAPCIGVSWGNGNKGGNCYLKYNITSTSYTDKNIDSCYKITYNKPGGSSVPVISPNPTPTPASSPGVYVPPASSPASSPAVYVPPVSSPASSPAVYVPSSSSSAVYVPPASSPASSASTPEQTITTVPACPANNNTLYTDLLGTQYHVKCGLNIVGDNGKPTHADTFERCLELCDLTKGCAGVTWSTGPKSTDINCYPYTSNKGYSTAGSQICSGVPVNGPTNYAPGQVVLCPNTANGTIITDVFGFQYRVGCGNNLAGDNLPSCQTNTLTGCFEYCSGNQYCKGVVFQGVDGGPLGQSTNCFPKSSIGTLSDYGNDDYAIRVS